MGYQDSSPSHPILRFCFFLPIVSNRNINPSETIIFMNISRARHSVIQYIYFMIKGHGYTDINISDFGRTKYKFSTSCKNWCVGNVFDVISLFIVLFISYSNLIHWAIISFCCYMSLLSFDQGAFQNTCDLLNLRAFKS